MKKEIEDRVTGHGYGPIYGIGDGSNRDESEAMNRAEIQDYALNLGMVPV